MFEKKEVHSTKEKEYHQLEDKLVDINKSDGNNNELLQKMYPIEHYRVIKEIGRGSYGTVASAFCLKTGKDVAIKRIPNAF